MKSFFYILCIMAVVALLSGSLHAGKKETPPSFSTPLPFTVPDGFPQPKYNFSANPLTKEGFELGRKLFYDGQLSQDGNFSCASCHQQFAAFATFDHDLSHGFNNSFTTRNAPSLANLAWQTEFQHDGGVNNLELQPLAPLLAKNEMAETLENILLKLQKNDTYKKMFRAAFGDEVINSQRLLKAVSQFTVCLVSANSKYDKVKKGEAIFTPYEELGYKAFQSKCATCHKEPLFSDFSYRNIGLSISPFLKDYGRMIITANNRDSFKFKVPSLRNVAVTAPYMHDGRFATLQDCLQHYRTGVLQSTSTDPLLVYGIRISAADEVNLIAFLKTLTDSSFIKDPRFAQP